MASSINFNPSVRKLIPHELLERYRIIPVNLKKEKLCLIAHRPLTDQALSELKAITGIEDYELQLVGDDVLTAYIKSYCDGSLFEVAS